MNGPLGEQNLAATSRTVTRKSELPDVAVPGIARSRGHFLATDFRNSPQFVSVMPIRAS